MRRRLRRRLPVPQRRPVAYLPLPASAAATATTSGAGPIRRRQGVRDRRAARPGAAFVDVTDPTHPVYLGNLPTQTGNSLWRDIKVYRNYAFIVSEASGHGMQVFDLTQLVP